MNSPDRATTESGTIATLPGGYRRINVHQVLQAWHAYRTEKRIRFVDFRAYLALHEMAERRQAAKRRQRRCRLQPGQEKAVRVVMVEECARLLRARDSRVAAGAIQRLARAGLISVSDRGIEFCGDGPSPRSEAGLAGQHGGNVPRRTMVIPRRILRHLAAGVAVVEAATILGHLLRCVFYHRGIGWRSVGSCSTRYVAELFAVDARSVKRARRTLIGAGWLIAQAADHWHVQAHGSRMGVVLGWCPGDVAAGQRQDASRMSPLAALQAHRLSPPVSNRTLPLESKNHTPAQKRESGPCGRTGHHDQPRLADVQPGDLVDPHRLRRLCDEAVERGWISGSEHDRLRVCSAAAHARRVGRSNPCGLFVAVLRRGLWTYLSIDDDDAGRGMLRAIAEPCPVGPEKPAGLVAHSRGFKGQDEALRGINDLTASLVRAFTLPGSSRAWVGERPRRSHADRSRRPVAGCAAARSDACAVARAVV